MEERIEGGKESAELDRWVGEPIGLILVVFREVRSIGRVGG